MITWPVCIEMGSELTSASLSFVCRLAEFQLTAFFIADWLERLDVDGELDKNEPVDESFTSMESALKKAKQRFHPQSLS